MNHAASEFAPRGAFCSAGHAAAVLKRAHSIGIDGIDFLLALPLDYICRAYNGIGPASFPLWLRRTATFLLRVFEPAVMVRDCRFHQSDGSTLMFWFANGEFSDNLFVCARAACGWWNPLRYVLFLLAYAVSLATNLFGWKAWIAAAEANANGRGRARPRRNFKPGRRVARRRSR